MKIITTTYSLPTPGTTPVSRRIVGNYVGVTTADRVIGSFTDVEQPTQTLRQQAATLLRSLREPTPASGHGFVR